MLTTLDMLRLTKFLIHHSIKGRDEVLESKLQTSKVVESIDTPHDLVTMNSEVLIFDITKTETMRIKLVYQLAPFNGNQASILSPLGSALLGMRINESKIYELRDGSTREIRVLDILFQPEKSGLFDL